MRGASVDPEIVTPRLRLSRLVESDAPAMFAYRGDPDVCRYQSFEPASLSDVEAFITRSMTAAFDTPGAWFQFAIRLRGSDQLVGDVGVHVTPDYPRQVELGFTVAPTHQGQGIGSEAVTGVLDTLLVDLGKHRVIASVDPRNEASVRLLQRVGMRQEAHFHKSLWFKGEWADDVVFGVLASEWRARRPNRSGRS